jgi:hypothetical protein
MAPYLSGNKTAYIRLSAGDGWKLGDYAAALLQKMTLHINYP